MSSKTLVVAYCRVSTLEQKRRGYGIAIQLEEVQRFAEREGLVIDRFYRDEAESGVLEHRTELRRLLRDCRSGRIRTIVIPNLERLSRNVRIAENLFYRFARQSVSVLIVDMPHYNGNDRKDVMIRQIREVIAEDNRKDIIERLWKGRQQRVRGGRPAGGNVPYGYVRSGAGFVIEPNEAAVVR